MLHGSIPVKSDGSFFFFFLLKIDFYIIILIVVTVDSSGSARQISFVRNSVSFDRYFIIIHVIILLINRV